MNWSEAVNESQRIMRERSVLESPQHTKALCFIHSLVTHLTAVIEEVEEHNRGASRLREGTVSTLRIEDAKEHIQAAKEFMAISNGDA